MQRLTPNENVTFRYDAIASIRNPRARRQSVGMGDPLESVTMALSNARPCFTAVFNTQVSSDVMRRSNLSSLSSAWLRPEWMHSRARAPMVCARGGVPSAEVATRGKMVAMNAAAKKAERRAATACPRLPNLPKIWLTRSTAPMRRSLTTVQRRAMVGRLQEGTREGQMAPSRVQGQRLTNDSDRRSISTRFGCGRNSGEAEILRASSKRCASEGTVREATRGDATRRRARWDVETCAVEGRLAESRSRDGVEGVCVTNSGTALVLRRQAHCNRKGGGGVCHSPPLWLGC